MLHFFLAESKFIFRYLEQGVKEYRKKYMYIFARADKDENNAIVVRQLHYIKTLKQELQCLNIWNSCTDEKSIVDKHSCNIAVEFGICIK